MPDRQPSLLRADMPLVQAAAMLGFADQAYFAPAFGSVVGMALSTLRRLLHSRDITQS